MLRFLILYSILYFSIIPFVLGQTDSTFKLSVEYSIVGGKLNAQVGDTILYKLKVKNNQSTNIIIPRVFNPLPLNTDYLNNSADNGGSLGDIIQNNIQLRALVWNNLNLAGLEEKELRFMVQIASSPEKLIINNAAFAISPLTADTLSSGCDLATVSVNKTPQLTIKKNVSSGNPTGMAYIADTILYRIKLKNNYLTPIKGVATFDPLPSFTRYLGDSNSGELGIVNINGKDVPAIKWPTMDFEPLQEVEFSFKVSVSKDIIDSPPLNISNKAYVAYNQLSDTLISEAASINVDQLVGEKGVASLVKSVKGVNLAGEIGLGDTLIYTLKAKNNLYIPANYTVFDPIPLNTRFVEGSANAGGIYSSIEQNGKTLMAVVWENMLLTSEQDTTLSFKVIVEDIPPGANPAINNIAFLHYTLEGVRDTISSAKYCEILSNSLLPFVAMPDYFTLLKNTSSEGLRIAKNDSDPLRNVVETSLLVPPTQGDATLNPDGSLNYTPFNNFTGVDSLSYRLSTLTGKIAEAKVYFLVMDTDVNLEIACEDALVNLSVIPQAGIQNYWFSQEIGGVPDPLTASNTKTILKDGTPSQTFWVEPVWNGKVFTRFAFEVQLSQHCGIIEPIGCAEDGLILWKDDFGGKSPFAPSLALQAQHRGTLTESFVGGNYALNPGEYALVKSIPAGTNDSGVDSDYTKNNNEQSGYMLMLNSSKEVIYQADLGEVCEGLDLYFSFWINNYSLQDPNLSMIVIDETTGEKARFTLGQLGKEDGWKQYGFWYHVKEDASNLVLRIINNQPLPGGSLFAMDNIEIRSCIPKVEISMQKNEVCIDSQVEIDGLYLENENSILGSNVLTWWEFSEDGVNWSKASLSKEVSMLQNSLEDKLLLTLSSESQSGYYRMYVANPQHTNKVNCFSYGETYLKVLAPSKQVPDIRIKYCPSDLNILHLASYLDTNEFKSVRWERVSTNSPEFISGTEETSGSLNTNSLAEINKYKYSFTNTCYTSTASIYISKIKNLDISDRSLVVCRKLSSSAQINLNQLLGIQVEGMWSYSNDLSPYVSKIEIPSTFAGAILFNAQAAWEYLPDSYRIQGGYNGDMDAKLFEFTFSPTTNSCILNKTITVRFIVTETQITY